jgi:hypothetical protein
MGSNSCEGKEKRTAAISVTPINLEKARISIVLRNICSVCAVRIAIDRCLSIIEQFSFAGLRLITYFRNILKKVLSFEESSTLSETAAVVGGVETDGMETVELAVEGTGDSRSMVEPDEAYAMLDQVEYSR